MDVGIINFGAFFVTSILFTITPGIDTVFVLNKSIGYGYKGGFATIAGITAGNLVHVTLTALGLSLLVARYPLLYDTLKYLGAAYMAYLGVSALYKLWRSKHENSKREDLMVEQNNFHSVIAIAGRKHFVSGLITNLLNPKIPLFFIAYLPQFVAAGFEDSPYPFIILGLTLAMLGIVWFVLLTLFAGAFSERLKKSTRITFIIELTTGVVFILLAVLILTQGVK